MRQQNKKNGEHCVFKVGKNRKTSMKWLKKRFFEQIQFRGSGIRVSCTRRHGIVQPAA